LGVGRALASPASPLPNQEQVMAAPVVAVVTGFPKNSRLIDFSFATLRALKAKGIIQRILYVTWDTPALDALVAPAAAMDDIEFVRVPQPEITGNMTLVGVMYQVHNLAAALALIPDDDSLVLKTRTDFVIDQDFLESKIVRFDTLCAPSVLPERLGIAMPPAAFSSKIWLPWADANQPLALEDAAFMGRKRDIAKLADCAVERFLHADYCGQPVYGEMNYIARYFCVFGSSYPIFQNYLHKFGYLPNTMEYRHTMLSAILHLPFFWYLVVANAWVIATNFHVDCGLPGQLMFYSSSVNKDWSSPKELKVHPPYDDIPMWRAGQMPGGVFPCAARLYSRLVDDSWQQALFTKPVLRDLTPDNLRSVLHNVASYPTDPLLEIEDQFYDTLADLYYDKWQTRGAAQGRA
jgi:hypothetical protein